MKTEGRMIRYGTVKSLETLRSQINLIIFSPSLKIKLTPLSLKGKPTTVNIPTCRWRVNNIFSYQFVRPRSCSMGEMEPFF